MLKKRSCLGYLIFVLCLMVAACQYHPPAYYDANTDNVLTDLQGRVDGLLLKIEENLGTSGANYTQYRLQYETIDVDLELLMTRAKAIPNNQPTIQALGLLQNSLQTLQNRHRLGFHQREELRALTTIINNQFEALLSLELAKPRHSS